jgi:very-short-patch-repair endonuclease
MRRRGRDARSVDVVAVVRARGGLARSAELVRAGATKRAIAAAVASGRLRRLRRVWVAVPEADPQLREAAEHSVVLSCVTQARRLGLWVLDHGVPHVAAPVHASAIGIEHAVVHWGVPPVPRHPHALEDPVENVLATVAGCQPFEPALAVWESALRADLVDRRALARLPLSARARELLARANPYADSGLETVVPQRLRWLRVRILPQVWIAGHRVDFLIGERLVLQIDGGHHVGAQRAADIAHDAELMLLGYHVIRVGYTQVMGDWPAVQDRIQRAIAQGLHRAA